MSDTQRTYFEIAITMIGAAQMFIISNAFIADKPVDPTALWVLALVIAVIAPLKAYLGVRDSTTSQIAVAANKVDDSFELRQFRKIDPDQINTIKHVTDDTATSVPPTPSLPPETKS